MFLFKIDIDYPNLDEEIEILSREHKLRDIEKTSNGYEAKEVVEYLREKGIEYFDNTRAFNKHLIDKGVLNRTNGIYEP